MRRKTLRLNRVEILRERLEQTGLPVKGSDKVDPARHEGFREAGSDATIFTIKSTVFRAWFPNPASHRRALIWLHSRNLLLDSGKIPSTSTSEWAVTSPRWGDKKVKSVRFKDPFATK